MAVDFKRDGDPIGSPYVEETGDGRRKGKFLMVTQNGANDFNTQLDKIKKRKGATFAEHIAANPSSLSLPVGTGSSHIKVSQQLQQDAELYPGRKFLTTEEVLKLEEAAGENFRVKYGIRPRTIISFGRGKRKGTGN